MSGQANERTRPDELIEHGPVTLRRYRADDAEAVFAAVTESLDHLRPWMPWAAGYTRESAAEYLDGSIRSWEDGTEYNYAILAGGRLAGSVGLMARIGPGGLEIGYWVHRAYTGRGLATAAPRRWWTRRSGCPAWTGWRSSTTSSTWPAARYRAGSASPRSNAARWTRPPRPAPASAWSGGSSNPRCRTR